jgi:branched-subunit amino acid aminotransferase/4-amino-4-deoxychorismate lyase
MQLLETMKVEADGNIPLLERNLARISSSALVFGFACEVEELRAAILQKAKSDRETMFRLLLARDGAFELHLKPMIPFGISRLGLAARRVNSADRWLYHKTTNRTIYEGATDAILINERGEATETGIANIAVLRNGQWVTPAISCGLLPGTRRAQLLEEGAIVEGIILAKDLVPGETVRFFNGRGVFEAPFGAILAT